MSTEEIISSVKEIIALNKEADGEDCSEIVVLFDWEKEYCLIGFLSSPNDERSVDLCDSFAIVKLLLSF